MVHRRQIVRAHLHNCAFPFMAGKQKNKSEAEPQRIKLTARLTLTAYDAIVEIQRRYRRKTGRAIPLWKILDAAIVAYAKKLGITVGE